MGVWPVWSAGVLCSEGPCACFNALLTVLIIVEQGDPHFHSTNYAACPG